MILTEVFVEFIGGGLGVDCLLLFVLNFSWILTYGNIHGGTG